jgi:transcriptional regulator with XRE-family HTH domain
MLATYNNKDTTVKKLSTLCTMGNFDAARFAAYLNDAYLRSQFKSHSALATAAGLKRSTVSSLISAKPQSATNKPSQPRAETVIALAQALDLDVDNALLAAGHAPRSPGQSVSIGFEASVKLGTNVSPEERQEIAEELALAYEVIMERRRRRHTHSQ